LYDVLAGPEASRLMTMPTGAHVEDFLAPFSGAKSDVLLMQKIELNLLKQWLRAV